MKKSNLLLTSLIGLVVVSSAFASVLYDNGPYVGGIDSWAIYEGFAVSDSFTLSGAGTVTGADLAMWLYPGDSLTAVDWSISTGPLGTGTVEGGGSGTPVTTEATLCRTMCGTYNCLQCSAYIEVSDSFAVPSLGLTAGSYYLTLQNGITAKSIVTGDTDDPDGLVAWDINNGPSTAYESYWGNVANVVVPGTNSETFQILGSANAPEPGTFVLGAATGGCLGAAASRHAPARLKVAGATLNLPRVIASRNSL